LPALAGWKPDYCKTLTASAFSINNDWRFFKYDRQAKTDDLMYDIRPEIKERRGASEYRLRWDDVRYEPGELRVVLYKSGKKNRLRR
jgi:hypothetical protein